jgi:CDP-diacylglycerol---glycerol-3-phosphate 3-phosphatidyltransferase
MEEGWKLSAQRFAYKYLNPLINFLVKIGVTPNGVTVMGLLFNILAAIIFIYGVEKGNRGDHRIIGAACFVILLGGLMDMIDGRLARVSKQESKYGAIFDSVLDRYSEMIMFLGICYYLIGYSYFLSSLFAFVGMIGSIMVSYTRARAEGMGLKMGDVGFMQRPERILLLGISGLLCGIFSHYFGSDYKVLVSWLPFPAFETISFFTFPLFILALLSNATAINRLFAAKKMLEEN